MPARARPSRWTPIALVLAFAASLVEGALIVFVATPPEAAPAPPPPPAETKSSRIEGTVTLQGEPPKPQVPAARPGDPGYAFCKDRKAPADEIRVHDGHLAEVLVRIPVGEVKGDFPPPEGPVKLLFSGCAVTPRMQGAVVGQEIEIRSADATEHDVHIRRGDEPWKSQIVSNGKGTMLEVLDAPGLLTITCENHPLERAFVFVSDHPFFAVTDAEGRYVLPDVPVGHYGLESWHARFGTQRVVAEVTEKPLVLDLAYAW